MSRNLNIVVMLGGPSAEREVSLRSGAGVAQSLRSLGHHITEVDPKDGTFVLPEKTDVVFLALHGTYGEDGVVQQALEKLGVPYTGCDSEASRVAFDKVLTKQRCIETGVPTAKFIVVESDKTPWPMGWQPPVVVKPVRQGSSVGLQFVERVADWSEALREAFRYDSQLLAEEKIVGRETTVGILADIALPIVEVRPKSGSYDYRNKYTAGNTDYFCPANFDAAGLHLGPLSEPFERFDQGRKAVDAAALRVQVDELGRFAGVLADALQIVTIDRVRNEALFMLHLHRIERAPVRIDADQEFLLTLELETHETPCVILDFNRPRITRMSRI